MTMNEYQEEAKRTINPMLSHNQKVNHALFGMASEVGEIQGIYQKLYQGHGLNAEEMAKELGDLLWFIAEYCTVHGFELEEIAQMNIDKLRRRYPFGFDTERSLHRES